MDAFEIDYALAKQVPAMRQAVTLGTDYGDLVFEGADAAQVAALVERVLLAKRKPAEDVPPDEGDGHDGHGV